MTRTNELFHVSFPICPRNPLKYELTDAVCGRKVEPRSNWEKRDPKTGTLISSIVPRPVQIIRLSRFLSPFSFLFTLKLPQTIQFNSRQLVINSEFRSDPVTVRMPQCLNLLLSGRNDKVASGTGNRTVAFSLSLPIFQPEFLGGERARDSFFQSNTPGLIANLP